MIKASPSDSLTRHVTQPVSNEIMAYLWKNRQSEPKFPTDTSATPTGAIDGGATASIANREFNDEEHNSDSDHTTPVQNATDDEGNEPTPDTPDE